MNLRRNAHSNLTLLNPWTKFNSYSSQNKETISSGVKYLTIAYGEKVLYTLHYFINTMLNEQSLDIVYLTFLIYVLHSFNSESSKVSQRVILRVMQFFPAFKNEKDK